MSLCLHLRVYMFFGKVVSRVKAGHKFARAHEEFFSIMRLILLRLRREIRSVFAAGERERTPRSASGVIHFV